MQAWNVAMRRRLFRFLAANSFSEQDGLGMKPRMFPIRALAVLAWSLLVAVSARGAQPDEPPQDPGDAPAVVAPPAGASEPAKRATEASAAPAAQADDTPVATDGMARAASDWLLERVVLNDGRSYQGLVQSENAASIDFLEVRRPRGKPMSLVLRPMDRKSIESWKRLEPEQQQILRARLEKYKHKALIEGRRMEDLVLTATRQDGVPLWTYRGNWISLDSTADEAMTRRAIVRLGQIFAAYRQLLPPRWHSSARVHIRLFGSSDQYRLALKEWGLQLKNPAVYLADRNLILAGSDLNRFDAELAQVNRQHRQIRMQLDALLADMPARLKELGEDLTKNGVSTAERLKILVAEQRKYDDERKVARRKMAALDRKNQAKFNEVAGQMFTRLAHEAFHAYLETYVYPHDVYDVPRWLNEGLAQTFEAGLLEADTLRVDTPNAAALARLQTDLRGDAPLSLAEVLESSGDVFLSAHTASGTEASRLYDYSWGLAYYLAFEQDVLSSSRFDAYLSPAASALSPVERFERLVGMPLAEFEKQWRVAMLALKNPTSRASE